MAKFENLLAATQKALSENGKSPADVRWVETHEGMGSWEQFAALANRKYDSGHTGPWVEWYLRVVGDDWWLERGEYDGSEWWEFKTQPVKPDLPPLTRIWIKGR